jgi:hypothetical protein
MNVQMKHSFIITHSLVINFKTRPSLSAPADHRHQRRKAISSRAQQQRCIPDPKAHLKLLFEELPSSDKDFIIITSRNVVISLGYLIHERER